MWNPCVLSRLPDDRCDLFRGRPDARFGPSGALVQRRQYRTDRGFDGERRIETVRKFASRISTDLDRDLGDGGSPLALRGLQPRNRGPVRLFLPGRGLSPRRARPAAPDNSIIQGPGIGGVARIRANTAAGNPFAACDLVPRVELAQLSLELVMLADNVGEPADLFGCRLGFTTGSGGR
jgi:hypothetical protein